MKRSEAIELIKTHNLADVMKLSEPMRRMIRFAEPGDFLRPGATRRALVARRVVWNNVESVPGPLRSTLTPLGELIREQLISQEK